MGLRFGSTSSRLHLISAVSKPRPYLERERVLPDVVNFHIIFNGI
jgi:hypothetical protein